MRIRDKVQEVFSRRLSLLSPKPHQEPASEPSTELLTLALASNPLPTSSNSRPQSRFRFHPPAQSILLALPLDLLILIIETLPIRSRRTLSQTCKWLHNLSLPYLNSTHHYTKITFPRYCGAEANHSMFLTGTHLAQRIEATEEFQRGEKIDKLHVTVGAYKKSYSYCLFWDEPDEYGGKKEGYCGCKPYAPVSGRMKEVFNGIKSLRITVQPEELDPVRYPTGVTKRDWELKAALQQIMHTLVTTGSSLRRIDVQISVLYATGSRIIAVNQPEFVGTNILRYMGILSVFSSNYYPIVRMEDMLSTPPAYIRVLTCEKCRKRRAARLPASVCDSSSCASSSISIIQHHPPRPSSIVNTSTTTVLLQIPTRSIYNLNLDWDAYLPLPMEQLTTSPITLTYLNLTGLKLNFAQYDFAEHNVLNSLRRNLGTLVIRDCVLVPVTTIFTDYRKCSWMYIFFKTCWKRPRISSSTPTVFGPSSSPTTTAAAVEDTTPEDPVLEERASTCTLSSLADIFMQTGYDRTTEILWENYMENGMQDSDRDWDDYEDESDCWDAYSGWMERRGIRKPRFEVVRDLMGPLALQGL